MKKILIMLSLLFSLKCYAKYALAVCAIFQNEAPYLKEWIEFHQKQGVQHFYLYNNLSQDDYQKMLSKYVEDGLVTLIEWPYSYETLVQWNDIQCRAYNDCLNKTKNTVKWCAFIDLDEFLFCPDGIKLTKQLQSYEKFHAIGVNWINYGTSLRYLSKGESVLKYLVLRSEDNWYANKTVKTIVNVANGKYCVNPHFFYVNDQTLSVNENKEPIEGPTTKYVSAKKFRINHYSFRDMRYFAEEKTDRLRKIGRSEEFIKEMYDIDKKGLNIVYDPILVNF